MALIKCAECGNGISDKAASCPQCGCPTNVNSSASGPSVVRPSAPTPLPSSPSRPPSSSSPPTHQAVPNQWYCKVNGTVMGPMSGQRLNELAGTGRLQPTDFVRRGEDGPWSEARLLKGLAAPSQPADGHRSDSRHQFALPFFPPRPPGTSNRNYYISVVSRTRIVPLAVCTLGLGWVLSYVTPERFFLPTWTVLIPIALLAAPALVLAVLSGVFFVRPNDVEFEPTKRCILALTFTMTAGLVLLLVFYKIADLELHTHGFRTGGVPRLYEAFVKFIGWSYENVDSSSLVTRLIANIFSFGLCEEITKLLPLFYFALKKSNSTPANSLTYRGFLLIGFFSGLGFGIGEALLRYSPWYNPPHNLLAAVNILRWFACVPSHAIYGMIDAAVLWYLLPIIKARSNIHAKFVICAGAAGVMAIVHGVYDVVCAGHSWGRSWRFCHLRCFVGSCHS